MARAIEVPVVAKKGTLARSIEGEAATAFRNLGRSSGAVAPLGRMLGKIRADADEFTKSIEASNARVIAFGASVGVINGISNAFKELVRVTVSVEKSLTDINVVLNANQSQLTKFGDGLFKVAKNTAQSFDVVAEAATEFARQGLSIEETLKRTNDALILTRLTGLKAAESVKGLTAATNGFAKAGLSTTQIINKLAAVDVKFAVSADDLIAALSRTGAVAQEAGLSMDELIGMVTAAQQVTARGGPVIGNAFKTIFTRVQRPETLKTLRELKIAVEDTSGAALPASKVLQNLATSYDGLSRSAKDAVNQQVAGVFQINILKAAIGDLQKQNSIAARATAVSASATDQAAKKNEMLNQTIAALSTQTGLALTELAKKIGDISIAPGMRDLIGSFKALVEGTTGVLDGEGTGSDFARGLLKGIGNVLTGPGLIVIGGVFIKLFKDLTVFGMSSLKNLLGLNNAAKQQAALQQGIGTLLQTNAAYQTQMAAATGNVNKQAAITQRFLQQEITLRQQAAALTGGMAGAAFMGGFRVDKAGDVVKKKRGLRGMVPGLAPTEVPNFGFRAFNPRVTKAGGTAVGSSPFQFTSSSMLGTSENYRGTFNLNASKAALAKELPAGLADIVKNSTMSGFQMQTKMAGFSPRQQEEMIGRMRNAVSTVPGLSDRAREALITAHTGSKSLIEVNKGINRALKREDISKKERGAYDQHMGEVTEKYFNKTFGTVGTGGRQGADYAIDAIRYRRGRTDPMELKKLAGFTTGDATTIASAIKKQLVSGHNPALRNRLREEAQRQGKLEKFEQAMLERFAQEYRAYVINNPGGLRGRGAFGKESYFTGLSRDQVKKGNLANLSPEQKQHIQDEVLRYNRQVLNFAPIGDAIKREKLQVGGLLGINPSQVKTKVIQNTALRSSFNPGGFGVISPTIGQNSFADARRMHKGEDLRTANLPNFMTPLPVSGISPKRPALSMTPVGYSEVIKTTIHGVTPEASKTLGAGVAKSITTEVRKLTPPAPMSRGVTIPPTSLTTNIKALDTLAKPRAGRLGNFGMNAFMAYTAGTMAGGFAPQAEQMFGLRPGQGEGALTGAALGGFVGMKAGAALGSMLAPGAGTIVGGALGLGAGALGGGYLGAAGLGNTFESARSLGNVATGTGGFMYPDEIAFEKAQMTEFFGSQSAKQADLYLQYLKNARLDNKTTERTSDIARAAQQARLSRDIQAGRMGGFGGFIALERQQRIDTERRTSKQGVQRIETNAAQAEKFIRDIEKIIPAGTGGILGAQLKNQLRAMAAVGDFQGILNIFESMRAENQPVLSGEKGGGIPEEFYRGTAPPEVAEAFRGDIGLSSPRRVGPTGAQAIFMKETPLEKAMLDNMGKIDPTIINQGITDNPEFADAITKRGGVTAQSVMDLNTKLTEITRTNTEFVDGLRNAVLTQKEMEDSFNYENKIEQTQEALAKLNEQMKHVDAVTKTATSSLGNAFSAITTGSSSAGDAFSNMAISILGEINKINNQFIASEIMSFLPTTGLFKALTPTAKNKAFDVDVTTHQKGGIIKAQNGMYISGGRTGDKNPALLEDGEYVLNRNAVKAMGGPGALDALNFNMAPRFAEGGGFMSGLGNILMAPFNFIGSLFQGIFGGGGGRKRGRAMSGTGTSIQSRRAAATDRGLAETNKMLAQLDAISGRRGGAGSIPSDSAMMSGIRKRAARSKQLKHMESAIKNYAGINPGAVGLEGIYSQDQAGVFSFGGGRPVPMGTTAVIDVLNDAKDIALNKGAGAGLVYLEQFYRTNPRAFDRLSGFPHGQNFSQKEGFFMDMFRSLGVTEFASGGRLGSPISRSGVKSSALESIIKDNEFLPPVAGMGSALGGGGASVRLGITDPRLSGFAHANDPILQNVRSDIQSYHEKQRQKKFEKQAKRDEMTKMIVGAIVGSTVSAGVGAISEAAQISKMEKAQPGFDKSYYKDLYKQGYRVKGADLIKKQRGGHIDNIPAMLTGGEFVVNPSTVRRHGSAFFSKLNRGGRIGYQTGGIVGDQQFVPAQGDTQNNNKTETSNNNATSNTTVNITVNSGTGEASVDGGNAGTEDREMATRLRDAVLSVLKQEKRTGGMLRDVTSNDQ